MTWIAAWKVVFGALDSRLLVLIQSMLLAELTVTGQPGNRGTGDCVHRTRSVLGGLFDVMHLWRVDVESWKFCKNVDLIS